MAAAGGLVARVLGILATSTGEAPDAALGEALQAIAGAVGAPRATFTTDDGASGPDAGAGGLRIPAMVAGHSVGTLRIDAPEGAAEGMEGALAACATAIGMFARNAELLRGLADRVRALDRQALWLDAIARVARRVAEAPDADAAHAAVVAEGRDVARADGAVLIGLGAGAAEVLARDGEAPTAAAATSLARDAVAYGRPVVRDRLVGLPLSGEQDEGASGALVLVRPGRDMTEPGGLERLADLGRRASTALGGARLLRELRAEGVRRGAVAAGIVAAQEDERRRIAEEIHDGPVQELVGVGLLLDALAGSLAGAPSEAREDTVRAAAAAREAVRALRRAITDLHPLALDELGFAAAVRALVERLEWRGLEVVLDLDAAEGLGDVTRTVAFRVVQEAVANVLHHAEAAHVGISARVEGGDVVIEVRDDGRGFATDARQPGVGDGHLGLPAARERATLVGGDLSVVSAPGKGTTLRVRLPAAPGRAQSGPEAPGSRASAAASPSSSAKRSSTTT